MVDNYMGDYNINDEYHLGLKWGVTCGRNIESFQVQAFIHKCIISLLRDVISYETFVQ